MTATAEPTVMERLLDPVGECFTPEVAERILALRADPIVQARLDDLLERNREGQITEDERDEMFSIVRTGSLISVLQAKARRVLNGRRG